MRQRVGRRDRSGRPSQRFPRQAGSFFSTARTTRLLQRNIINSERRGYRAVHSRAELDPHCLALISGYIETFLRVVSLSGLVQVAVCRKSREQCAATISDLNEKLVVLDRRSSFTRRYIEPERKCSRRGGRDRNGLVCRSGYTVVYTKVDIAGSAVR